MEQPHLDYMILKGAAGTGKTSILKAIVEYLSKVNASPVLVAPTGRAAQTLSDKTGTQSTTIHRLIYQNTPLDNGKVACLSRENESTRSHVYIIDECSMISDKRSFDPETKFQASNSLLNDLIQYTTTGNFKHKIIFVGDPCQLPPVGYTKLELAPVFVPNYLNQHYKLSGITCELKEVKRQTSGSSILSIATDIRGYIERDQRLKFAKNIGEAFYGKKHAAKLYLDLYNSADYKKAVILSLGNAYAKELNTMIRGELGLTGSLQKNDYVVLNQTHYKKNESIASGTTATVIDISHKHTIEDCNFAMVTLQLANGQIISSYALMDLLAEPNYLDQYRTKALFAYAMKNNEAFRKSKAPWDDPYVGALNLSYGHAINCYKAQGGEWNTVIFNSWMNPKNYDNRFLYTGITRAQNSIFSNNYHLMSA